MKNKGSKLDIYCMSDNKLSKEHRDNISKALKKAHESGKHPGWSHVNSSRNYMSRPEKTFEKMLKEYGISDKYNIKYGLPVSKYFLDFALLEYKIDIEIDGVQHIRNKNNIEHDKIRDTFLLKEGWKVYRISAKELLNKNVINDLTKFIENTSNYRSYDPIEILKQYRGPKYKYGSRSEYSKAIKEKNNEKVKPIIQELLNSNIVFEKYGWVGEASKIIGITSQKVKKWMERYMPDFYKDRCYKRK
jgi:very-short-patch-repair endonuclease